MTPNASIIVSVSSHYKEPSYASEVVTQGILGERVQILDPRPVFTKIRQADGYTSWADSDQVLACDPPEGEPVVVRDHFIRIFKEPSRQAAGIGEAVIGSRLMAAAKENGWYRISLPGNRTGWAEKKHFTPFPSATPENILALAKEFIGYQYLWGGRTPKGFDCSGFVQTVFGLLGIQLPRDSRQQQENHLLSHNFQDAKPGDLLFFGKTPDKVTHVGICLGNQRFIHASGWIRTNSFSKADDNFSPEHVKKFISVNRYPLAKETS